MIIGDRTYIILSFLWDNEVLGVSGHELVKRAIGMNANLGEDDGQYLLDHQQYIPAALRGKVVFVFTDWRCEEGHEEIYYIFWHKDGKKEGKWVKRWRWTKDLFCGCDRILRREPSPKI